METQSESLLEELLDLQLPQTNRSLTTTAFPPQETIFSATHSTLNTGAVVFSESTEKGESE